MLKMNMLSLCALALATGSGWAAETPPPRTDKDRLSYSIGASIGKNLKKENTDVNLDLVIQGMKSGMAGDKLLMPEKEMRQILGAYQMELRQRLTASRQQAIAENKKKGDAFLASNKNKKGVKILPGGVQYKVIKEGHGKKPLESDMVEVNYRGTLIDGTEFDATEEGHPATLKASALIPGWKQALSEMSVGSKWQIAIPSQLAYGERGVGTDIGPNEVLLFDVELVAIK